MNNNITSRNLRFGLFEDKKIKICGNTLYKCPVCNVYTNGISPDGAFIGHICNEHTNGDVFVIAYKDGLKSVVFGG